MKVQFLIPTINFDKCKKRHSNFIAFRVNSRFNLLNQNRFVTIFDFIVGILLLILFKAPVTVATLTGDVSNCVSIKFLLVLPVVVSLERN